MRENKKVSIPDELIYKVAKVWQYQLNIEYENKEHNTKIAFKDIGPLCELMAIKYNPGFSGSGSGGMGFDLINSKTNKAIEVKSCCTIQNAKCKNCSIKFNNIFLSECPKCSSENFSIMKDSRFGIDAGEFLDQFNKNIIDNFTLCHISLINSDKIVNKISIMLDWYKIDFKDPEIIEHQLKYFQNQKNYGRKSHSNLLPLSYDFYKLSPKQVDKINIILNYSNLDVEPIVKYLPYSKELYVPDSVIPKDMLLKFEELKKKLNNKVATKDFTIALDYKKKSLGKIRGDTRTNKYKFLKKET